MKGPKWQIERICTLHRAFRDIALVVECEGLPLTGLLAECAARLDGTPLDGGRRVLRASTGTLVRAWYKWDAGGRKADALLPSYRTPAHVKKLPGELAVEIQRIASLKTGGRDKHGNGIEGAAIHLHLTQRWQAGEALPGVGTWRQWWARTQPGMRPPSSAPEFPWCKRTVVRNMGTKAVRTMGNIGRAAATKHLPLMQRDYSKLRKCEYYTLDDAVVDLVAIDVDGRVVRCCLYLLMEVASRNIIAFLCKPVKKVTDADVDELLAHGLQTDGYGIGVGYTTHIWFEQGTTACSAAAQGRLEGGSGGRIKVHRTDMQSGTSWIGAARDKASGKANSKAVIESFIRNLHRRLLLLPGQVGNCYQNMPANMGIGDKAVKDPSKRRKPDLSVAAEAEMLAQFKLTAMAAGASAELKLPLLMLAELQAEIAKALREFSTTRGHGMQGFHTVTEAEVAPGVWRQVSTH